MEFIDNLSMEDYKEFLDNFPYSHFLQTVTWGEVNKKTRGKIPCYVGLKDDNGKLVAAALLLKKNLLGKMCYYYCPRGYLIDFSNEVLLKKFSEEIKSYLKKTSGIYIKINPEIMYQEIDDNGKEIPGGKNNKEIFNTLIKLEYKHKGFVKYHENNEPRYTFRRYFDKYKNEDEINSSISKTFMKTVKRSYDYDLKIDLDANVNNFFELNKSNAVKDGFIQYSDNFYKTLYEMGKEYKNTLVFNVNINPKKQFARVMELYEELKKKIDNGEIRKKDLVDSQNKLTRLEKEVEFFRPYKDKEDVCVCSLISGVVNNMMWTMYIGNDSLGEKTFAVNRIYYEAIMYAYRNQYKFIDLYGTIGEPNSNYKNLSGLHDYKRKFGDTYIEFIGEFDLINNPFLYKLLPLALNVYRKIRRKK